MQLQDVPAVAAIAAETPARGWDATQLAREIAETPNARYVVAIEGSTGEVLGFAGQWFVVDLAHVTNMGVDAAHRRRGIGRALLLGLVHAAAAEAIDAITLEVRPSNVAAIALYEEFGFYVTGRRKGYYVEPLEDALIMSTESIASAAYRARLERIGCRIADTLGTAQES
jgi:ribosomal-protein-alanine N-acetyltransferase